MDREPEFVLAVKMYGRAGFHHVAFLSGSDFASCYQVRFLARPVPNQPLRRPQSPPAATRDPRPTGHGLRMPWTRDAGSARRTVGHATWDLVERDARDAIGP